MLEKPDLPDEAIVACLRAAYRLSVVQVAFLPLGADPNTAVYRVVAADGTPYFLKLRSGPFDDLIVVIPQLLRQQGLSAIIAPVPTSEQRLWARVDRFAAILYPFVEGQNGFERPVSDQQWTELGAVLKRIHTTSVPPALKRRIPVEAFAPGWRAQVRSFQALVERATFDDPVAARLAAFMRDRRDIIGAIVERAEQLAGLLQTRSLEFVLCHADIHAANLLLTTDDRLYVVDWDTLILAPKERDLMFVGAGLAICDDPEQATLFYRGYGQTELDPAALSYYRFERIVEDIAVYCEQLLSSDAGGADRQQSFAYFVASFAPENVVERAFASDIANLF